MPRLQLEFGGRLPKGVQPARFGRMVTIINQWPDLPDLAGVINLRLVDDAAMRALNRDYSGKDETTDVLSFSYIEDGQPLGDDIGDIAISVPAAVRQAAAAGTDLGTELALLLVHGTLHLLGFDHATPDQRQRLDRLQRQIMAAAGLTYRDFGWLS